MILGIATVVVLVLVAVAVLPSKKRDRDGTSFTQPFSRTINFRKQQLDEEAEAIADEYQRRSDEAWREELGVKAAALFQSTPPTTKKASKS